MLIEVCANSLESALNAQKAGADRIELCSELGIGGITPSYGLLQAVKEHIHIPVRVLIRPRGGDFVYSDDEFKVMLNDIQSCFKLGFSGVVSGVLLPNFSIDLARTKQLVDVAKPMKFTFHRAFDWVVHPLLALEQLEQLGVDYILTSGQQSKAIQGIELLKTLNQKATTVILMPGSGINADNAHQFKLADFKSIHFSAADFIIKNANRKALPFIYKPFLEEDKVVVSSFKTIADIVKKVK